MSAYALDDTAGSVASWSVPELAREGPRIVIDNGPVWAFYAPSGDVVGLAPDQRRPTADVRWFDMQAQPAQLAKVACQLAGSDLTRAQWQHYVGDRPYRDVCPTSS